MEKETEIFYSKLKKQGKRDRQTDRQTEHKYVLMTVFVAKLFLGGSSSFFFSFLCALESTFFLETIIFATC